MPHPYFLPGGLNLFQFSMPYLAEKVIDMLYNIIRKGDEEYRQEDENMSAEEIQKAQMNPTTEGQTLRLKINSIGRVRRMYKNLIEN